MRCYANVVYAVVLCPFVHQSVCNMLVYLGARKQCHTIGQGF